MASDVWIAVTPNLQAEWSAAGALPQNIGRVVSARVPGHAIEWAASAVTAEAVAQAVAAELRRVKALPWWVRALNRIDNPDSLRERAERRLRG